MSAHCRVAPPRLGLVARRGPVRGPPPFVPWYNAPSGRRWRALPGARAALAGVRAACGPRLRPAWDPAPQCAAGGSHTLQGMRKKCRTAGPAGRPGPLGRASRWPLGGFFARVPVRRHPLPPRLAGGGRGRFWLPSPGGGARSRGSRGREGFARPLPSRAPLGFRPLVFFLPPPASSCGPGAFPFAPAAGGCRLPLPHRARRVPRQPPAGAGGTVYRRQSRGRGTNESGKDRAGDAIRPP